MKQHALAYLKRGWSIVPCEPRGKQPLVRWADYNNRRPTEEEIERWWTKWPNANIAIICGKISGIVVVDVDTDRGGTTDGQASTGLVAKTGGGGFHLFYSYPVGSTRVPNRVGADGIDVRADGGYVIAAPSTHKSGQRYTWLQSDDPAPCPLWVIEKKDKHEKSSDHWLTSLLLEGTSPGTRNDDVARLAGYYAGKAIPPDVAEVLIHQWMKSQNIPLPMDEVSVTVRSVYRTAVRNKTSTQPESSDNSAFATLGMRDYMRKYGSTEIKWLVKGWLPDATIAFTASPPGGLKTWTMFDLAVSVASGESFFGDGEVENPGPVLIIQQEDFHGQVAERLAVITMGRLGIDPPSNDSDVDEFDAPIMPDLPIYLHPDRRLRFDDTTVIQGLEEKIKEIKPRLVIIDPLYSAASTDDYMTKSASDMFVLKRLRDTYGCTFFISHHTRKSSDSWDRQEMWGSQFLNAFLETGWQVRKQEDAEAIVVKRHFKVSGAVDPVRVDFTIDTSAACVYETKVEVIDDETANKVATKSPTSNLSHYLDALDGHGPCTAAALAESMGKGKSTVSRALKKLEDSGEATKDGSGRWSRIQLPEF